MSRWPDQVARFRANLSPAANGCVEWTGCRNDSGYGVITFDGRKQRAHRVAWQLANGPIPEGVLVCHRCDNPPCCNADHLFLGTKADNNQDMFTKGRWRKPNHHTGEDHWTHRHPERLARGPRRTICPKGHDLTIEANRLYPSRGSSLFRCRPCWNVLRNNWRHRKRAEQRGNLTVV